MNLRKNFSVLCISLLLFVFFTTSCSQQQTTEGELGRILSDPAPDTDGVTKILVYYDMEGISGLNDMKGLSFRNEEYKPAREWLTNDVNAVIEGLFAGGADVVHVVDAHGSGNPKPDILLDKMDSRAEMIFKDEPFRPYADLTEKGAYDAVVVVCMHSKTGGGGFAAHTYTIGMDWIVNDMTINESEIIAYSWGRADVPLIFASGDNKLQEQLAWMAWLEYVTVKKAKGATDAELRPFEEVHSEMRAAAERAVKNLQNSKAVKLTTPIKAQLRAVHPASLRMLNGVPGINYEDNTVTFEANNYLEAYDGIEALISVATTGYVQLLQQTVATQDNGAKIMSEFIEKLFVRWGEVESGRWKPPKRPETKKSSRKYFGAR
ncbi:MAG: M55 family metallopeptidase [Candidatus Aminicenantes bacterium]|nr:MAG: M55 family metallopeptidase [Candidatus Aminicenantes bacterium]